MYPPASRNSDYWTSHRAERRLTENGRREALTKFLARLVAEHPGGTDREYEAMAIYEGQLHKRGQDGVKLGLIHRGPERKCTITGIDAMTWLPGPEKGWTPKPPRPKPAPGLFSKASRNKVESMWRAE